jgi:hypothetical protein
LKVLQSSGWVRANRQALADDRLGLAHSLDRSIRAKPSPEQYRVGRLLASPLQPAAEDRLGLVVLAAAL